MGDEVEKEEIDAALAGNQSKVGEVAEDAKDLIEDNTYLKKIT